MYKTLSFGTFNLYMDIIQAKPYIPKKGDKYVLIRITDISFHSTEKRPTSIGLEIANNIEEGTASRIFIPLKNNISIDNTSSITEFLQNDPSFINMMREEQEKGYKVLIKLPEGGIPVTSSKDTEEFITSKNGKRVIRGLAKNEEIV